MPDKTIDALVSGIPAQVGDLIPISRLVPPYTTYRVTAQSIAALAIPGVTVSGTAPIALQTLVASDATHASWQPPNAFIVNAQGSGVTSYPAVIGDANNLVTMSCTTAGTFTIPDNATVALPIGTVLAVQQYGTGQITLTPLNGGVTINTASLLTTRAQYSTIGVVQVATDVWTAMGDLS